MAAELEPSENLGHLRKVMVASAARGGRVRLDDIEDVVQEAIIKALREKVRDGVPPFAARALRALADKQVEYVRVQQRGRARRDARPLAGPGNSEDAHVIDLPEPDPGFALVEMHMLCESIVGRDSLAYAVLKSRGATDHDVAELKGWTPQRVAAARMRLARRRAVLLRAMLDE